MCHGIPRHIFDSDSKAADKFPRILSKMIEDVRYSCTKHHTELKSTQQRNGFDVKQDEAKGRRPQCFKRFNMKHLCVMYKNN